MENSTAQVQCPRCQSKKVNKVSLSTHYCMACGVEFNADTLEIFLIALNGNLEVLARDEQLGNLVLERSMEE